MLGRRKILLKVILLGNSGVGKTNLIGKYVSNQFSEQYKTTIAADFLTKEIQIDNRIVTLQIWDTAGQERFQSLGAAFYRGADCCMIVYDVTSVTSFNSLNSWRDEFLIQANPRDPENFPFVIIGNKVDLESRLVSSRKALSWCEDKSNMPHFETSCKTGLNINEAFETMARIAIARDKEIDPMPDIPTTKLTPKEEERPTFRICNC